jgi:hypothetical protein
MGITSPKWWLNMFMTTLMTMFFIYLIKKATAKVQLPIVSDIVESV